MDLKYVGKPIIRPDAVRKATGKAPSWNFNKYLVRADGKVLQHLDSKVAPESPEFAAAVESLLK